MSATTVDEVLEHVRAGDEQAEAAVGALAAYFDQVGRESTGTDDTEDSVFEAWRRRVREDETWRATLGRDVRHEWDEAVTKVMAFLAREPEHPDLVFALGKSQDPRIKPLLWAMIERFVSDRAHEELVWQALIALTNFDEADPFALDSVALLETVASRAASERARTLARQWLEVSGFGW
jgi:hypothetical protein